MSKKPTIWLLLLTGRLVSKGGGGKPLVSGRRARCEVQGAESGVLKGETGPLELQSARFTSLAGASFCVALCCAFLLLRLHLPALLPVPLVIE